jgi:hypothetical protein
MNRCDVNVEFNLWHYAKVEAGRLLHGQKLVDKKGGDGQSVAMVPNFSSSVSVSLSSSIRSCIEIPSTQHLNWQRWRSINRARARAFAEWDWWSKGDRLIKPPWSGRTGQDRFGSSAFVVGRQHPPTAHVVLVSTLEVAVTIQTLPPKTGIAS